MQRPPPPRRRPSRIPTRARGSLGDLRAPSTLSIDLAQSHDSGISRSVSLASLASSVPNATSTVLPRRATRGSVMDGFAIRKLELGLAEERDEDVHMQCRIALELLKGQNEELKHELTKKQLEMDNLRIELAVYSRRAVLPPPPDVPDFVMQQSPFFRRSQSCDAFLDRDSSPDEEEASESNDCERSIINFWRNKDRRPEVNRNSERSRSLTMADERSSETREERKSATPSVASTFEKSHKLISSTPSSAVSTLMASGESDYQSSLQALPRDDARSRVERLIGETHNTKPKTRSREMKQAAQTSEMKPPPVEWHECKNKKGRPNKLDIVKATARDGDLSKIKRLESPSAISLLSPRPYKQGALPPPFVTPLDLSKIINDSECESPSFEMAIQKKSSEKKPAGIAAHKILVNAQSNVAQSRMMLHRLTRMKNATEIPQRMPY